MGQVPSQAPQSMQAPASMTMCSSPMEIAPTGQEDSQAPQETQASPIYVPCNIHLQQMMCFEPSFILPHLQEIAI